MENTKCGKQTMEGGLAMNELGSGTRNELEEYMSDASATTITQSFRSTKPPANHPRTLPTLTHLPGRPTLKKSTT